MFKTTFYRAQTVERSGRRLRFLWWSIAASGHDEINGRYRVVWKHHNARGTKSVLSTEMVWVRVPISTSSVWRRILLAEPNLIVLENTSLPPPPSNHRNCWVSVGHRSGRNKTYGRRDVNINSRRVPRPRYPIRWAGTTDGGEWRGDTFSPRRNMPGDKRFPAWSMRPVGKSYRPVTKEPIPREPNARKRFPNTKHPVGARSDDRRCAVCMRPRVTWRPTAAYTREERRDSAENRLRLPGPMSFVRRRAPPRVAVYTAMLPGNAHDTQPR